MSCISLKPFQRVSSVVCLRSWGSWWWVCVLLWLSNDWACQTVNATAKKHRPYAAPKEISIWHASTEGIGAENFLYPDPPYRSNSSSRTSASSSSSSSSSSYHYLDSHMLMYTARAFPPPGGRRTAILVCPGGGFVSMALSLEGTQVARYLNKLGITAFVLMYRRPGRNRGAHYPLQDITRAIQIIRANAGMFMVHPNRIGVLGFSAGGHVASMLAVHFADYSKVPTLLPDDAVDHAHSTELTQGPLRAVSLRPDFVVLLYPVISMVFVPPPAVGSLSAVEETARQILLGVEGSVSEVPEGIRRFYSAELHVSEDTPPCFLLHSINDSTVSVHNTQLFYQALQRRNVSAELHLIRGHHHGYSMGGMYATRELSLQEQLWYKVALVRWLYFQGLLHRRDVPERWCDLCEK